jgi:hypothetical protein
MPQQTDPEHGAEPLFDLRLTNIPIIKVQQELDHYHTLLQDDQFRRKLANQRDPIDIGHLVWRGLPKDLLTYFLQRGILAVEACVDAAVEYQAAAEGRFNEDFRTARANIWNGRAGSANVFYNRLPGLLDARYMLCNADAALWLRTKRFYREIRNPLSHGMQLSQPKPESVLQALSFLMELMAWIDGWRFWHPIP